MDRIFLDANILFSAAYREDSRLRQLWTLPDVELVTSTYAVGEARRNLESPTQQADLDQLLSRVTVRPFMPGDRALPGVELSDKDRPILLAAIEANATHLLTGDVHHFGRYFGQRIEGVLIVPPAEYLRSRTEKTEKGQ